MNMMKHLCRIVAVLILGFSVPAIAVGNSVELHDPFIERIVMYIGHINPDCVADTVIGKLDRETLKYRATSIIWGEVYDTKGKSVCESSKDTRKISPRKKRVYETTFEYPSWKELKMAFAGSNFNVNDTIDDARIHIWGKIERGEEVIDTSLSLLIFGQYGLDTLSTLDLGAITDFQVQPFMAMHMKVDRDLKHEKKRDMTGKKSFQIMPVDLDSIAAFKPKKAIRQKDEQTIIAGKSDGHDVQVFPNPTSGLVQIKLPSALSGRYTIKAVSVSGEEIQSWDAEVSSKLGTLKEIDLRELPSGYYVLQVVHGGIVIGDYPVIVNR